MRFKTVLILVLFGSTCLAEKFIERLPVYGVIKPEQMTTSIGVNHGMVASIRQSVGDNVKRGDILLSVIEKETTRDYRTTITGQVAKIQVTQGAVTTPGMPLITVLNPHLKKIEVALSPQEAEKVKIGNSVYLRDQKEVFGRIEKISPLVDPDNGSVLSYIKPEKILKKLIGDILPLELAVRSIDKCKVVEISEVDKFTDKFKIEATSGNKACLFPKD